MWFLVSESHPGQLYGLVAGRDYHVGRLQADISVERDVTISRRHAIIEVRATDNKCSNNVTVSRSGPSVTVTLRDLNSKYGTYVGDEAIANSSNGELASEGYRLSGSCHLRDGERIQFGLRSSVFKVYWQSVRVTHSSLPSDGRTLLASAVTSIPGAEIVSSWDDNITHVAMNEIILTIKVVNALARGVPLVTPSFFTDFRARLGSKQRLPLAKDYLPSMKEKMLNVPGISCQVNLSRRHLFNGKRFIFALDSQRQKYETAIAYASGQCVTFEAGTCVGLENSTDVVIRPPKGKNIPEGFTELKSDLKRHNMALISEQSIGIAIVKDACDFDPSETGTLRMTESISTFSVNNDDEPRPKLNSPQKQKVKSFKAQETSSSTLVRSQKEALNSVSVSDQFDETPNLFMKPVRESFKRKPDPRDNKDDNHTGYEETRTLHSQPVKKLRQGNTDFNKGWPKCVAPSNALLHSHKKSVLDSNRDDNGDGCGKMHSSPVKLTTTALPDINIARADGFLNKTMITEEWQTLEKDTEKEETSRSFCQVVMKKLTRSLQTKSRLVQGVSTKTTAALPNVKTFKKQRCTVVNSDHLITNVVHLRYEDSKDVSFLTDCARMDASDTLEGMEEALSHRSQSLPQRVTTPVSVSRSAKELEKQTNSMNHDSDKLWDFS